MSTKIDYYEILGVPKTASDSDIKQAYKKMAKAHHPDMVAREDKEQAERKFKEINEAYQILSDPQKRKMYDQFGHAGMGGQPGNGQAGGSWGPFTYSYSAGGNPFDMGGGFDPFDVFEEIFGIRDGTEIKFSGKGMAGQSADIPKGDLYISVRVKSPREFSIVGSDIVISLELDFITAALGGNVEIPVVDTNSRTGIGKTQLKIPAGTQPNTKFLIKGKGLPKVNSSARGSALVQVAIKIPQRLNRKQRSLLEEYQKA